MNPAELCVYCRRRPVDPAWRPFCSVRCRRADLGRWLRGDYRIAGHPAPTEGDLDRVSDHEGDGEPHARRG